MKLWTHANSYNLRPLSPEKKTRKEMPFYDEWASKRFRMFRLWTVTICTQNTKTPDKYCRFPYKMTCELNLVLWKLLKRSFLFSTRLLSIFSCIYYYQMYSHLWRPHQFVRKLTRNAFRYGSNDVTLFLGCLFGWRPVSIESSRCNWNAIPPQMRWVEANAIPCVTFSCVCYFFSCTARSLLLYCSPTS